MYVSFDICNEAASAGELLQSFYGAMHVRKEVEQYNYRAFMLPSHSEKYLLQPGIYPGEFTQTCMVLESA